MAQKIVTLFSILLPLILSSCTVKSKGPSQQELENINLKRGEIVMCGSADKEFGDVVFETSCPDIVRENFSLAIAMLHSFEYDEAEKMFAKIIDAAPDCAMAYWGVAMCNFHPLWAPPAKPELEKGEKAVAIARSLKKSKKESEYMEAIGSFYHDWQNTDHRTRSIRYEQAMEKIHQQYPEDKEAAVFYALSLVGAADPADTTYSRQKKAGNILTSLYPGEPLHPGIIHYIIHSYDSPALASLALPAARKYASIAPASAHAQHMPSHIFTRLGLWDESIQSNLASTEAAKCYAEKTGIKGHWDEELHGLDYLAYAYLQKGDNAKAKELLDYLRTITEVSPVNFKEAYAFAAIPSRYVLENKLWKEATELTLQPETFPWKDYPWQKAILHFARALGFAHTDKLDSARSELKILNTLYDTLVHQKDNYKATQVQIQVRASQAWIALKEGKETEALKFMQEAAIMEDLTQKHPVTPGEVLPAVELLGDLLLELGKPDKALLAYEADLKTHPNRFNGIYGAATAAEKSHDDGKAKYYYRQLLMVVNSPQSNRPELEKAKSFMK
jgi:tetratricopeptide (TPR) repeat protein